MGVGLGVHGVIGLHGHPFGGVLEALGVEISGVVAGIGMLLHRGLLLSRIERWLVGASLSVTQGWPHLGKGVTKGRWSSSLG